MRSIYSMYTSLCPNERFIAERDGSVQFSTHKKCITPLKKFSLQKHKTKIDSRIIICLFGYLGARRTDKIN